MDRLVELDGVHRDCHISAGRLADRLNHRGLVNEVEDDTTLDVSLRVRALREHAGPNRRLVAWRLDIHDCHFWFLSLRGDRLGQTFSTSPGLCFQGTCPSPINYPLITPSPYPSPPGGRGDKRSSCPSCSRAAVHIRLQRSSHEPWAHPRSMKVLFFPVAAPSHGALS